MDFTLRLDSDFCTQVDEDYVAPRHKLTLLYIPRHLSLEQGSMSVTAIYFIQQCHRVIPEDYPLCF